MSKKLMVLALAVVSAALFALPAVAAAAPWEVDPEGVQFTSSGATAELVSSGASPVVCESNNGTGGYDAGSQTTGRIELTFHGCHTSIFGAATCTTAGQSTGTITTTELVFHNIMLEPTTPGILITSNNGHFASFTCTETGGFHISANIVVGGNGIVGDISSPGCNEESGNATLNFEQTSGVQKWQQEETSGTSYHLTSSTNGGTAVEAGEQATGTVSYAEEATITC